MAEIKIFDRYGRQSSCRQLQLPALRQTDSREIDLERLRTSHEDRAGSGLPESSSVAPRTEVEKLLADIWMEVLSVKQVSAYDNFFELGGHSLLAMKVISRIQRAFQQEVPMRMLFEAPTLALLAERIETGRAGARSDAMLRIQPVPRTEPLPLSFAQQRVWFLDQLEPGSTLYTVPFAVRMEGHLEVSALERSLNEVVARHEALRTTFSSPTKAPSVVRR